MPTTIFAGDHVFKGGCTVYRPPCSEMYVNENPLDQ